MEDIRDTVNALTEKFKSMAGEYQPEEEDVNELTYKNVMRCNKCDDSGLRVTFVNGMPVGIMCECDAKRKTMLALKKSGLEDAIKVFRFDNFKREEEFQKRMYDMSQKYIQQDEYGFLFYGGQRGTGKSHLGTAICNHFIDKGIRTRYTIYDELMSELKAHFNDSDYDEVLSEYAYVDVLYIDDFMKFDPTQSDIRHAFNLINLRSLKNNRTIITSERFLEEIVDIDSALGGRIKKRCGPFAMKISRDDNRDYRIR